jgi:hypothetical protein
LIRRPRIVAAADWSVDASKRRIAVAHLQSADRYVVASGPEKVRESAGLLERLRASAGPQEVALVGFDFPIGLPRVYANGPVVDADGRADAWRMAKEANVVAKSVVAAHASKSTDVSIRSVHTDKHVFPGARARRDARRPEPQAIRLGRGQERLRRGSGARGHVRPRLRARRPLHRGHALAGRGRLGHLAREGRSHESAGIRNGQ